MRELERWGLRHVEFDQTGPPPDGVDLVWLEAPSNPFLTMPDFEAAAAHPALVVCDSTAATPLEVKPLVRGCDVALHSATKFLAGHDDALVGALVFASPDKAARVREFRSRTGSVAAPDVAWLLLRGLQTLDVRFTRQTESARVIVDRIRKHPAVAVVRYPGFGALMSFDVADADAARRVETSTELIENRTSLGGVVSRIEARSRWEGGRVPPGLLRLSVGLEDVESYGQTSSRRSAGADGLPRPFSQQGRAPDAGKGRRPRAATARGHRRRPLEPRHVLHYLYFADEASATAADRDVAAAGYETTLRAPDENIAQWSLRAEKHGVVDAASVETVRAWFETVAEEHRGEYDGWEAAAEP